MHFVDRREAGLALAERLRPYAKHSVIYALPRGGVAVGVEVAQAFNAPLDLIIARKIGHPANPEYAVCAVTETGPLVCNEAERLALGDAWLKQAEAVARAEAGRRRQVYLAGHEPVAVHGKTAILVDDGIATGRTMLAAAGELQKRRPDRIIIAVPCAPADVISTLHEVADDIIVLSDPENFPGAVAMYYDDFPQLTDNDVTNLLESL